MARRDDVLEAAVRVLGESGIYGLTHRKVDQAGELPEGTASNHFRTRAKLLTGVVEHLVATDFRVWDQSGVPSIASIDDLIEAAAGFATWAVTDGRERTVAQIALLEAAITNSEIAVVLRQARREIEAAASETCARMGIDPTATVILLDATDAVIFRHLALSENSFDARPYFQKLIYGLHSASA